MTNEEAISIINFERCTYGELEEATKIATLALEKQMPKKPYIAERGCVDTYRCQNCKESLYEVNTFEGDFPLREMVYCDNCGQALDWSDTK